MRSPDWAITYGSTLRDPSPLLPVRRVRDLPTAGADCWLDAIGTTLDSERREIMLRRQLGLTKLYNLVNDPDITDAADPDVARMRAIHVELDKAVMAAYGWGTCRWTMGSTPTGRCNAGRSARPRGSRSSTGCWPRTTAGPPPQGARYLRPRPTTRRMRSRDPADHGPREPPSEAAQPAYRLALEPDGTSFTARENLADVLAREILGPGDGPDEVLDVRAGRPLPRRPARAGSADPQPRGPAHRRPRRRAGRGR